jgi:hypothetical protein
MQALNRILSSIIVMTSPFFANALPANFINHGPVCDGGLVVQTPIDRSYNPTTEYASTQIVKDGSNQVFVVDRVRDPSVYNNRSDLANFYGRGILAVFSNQRVQDQKIYVYLVRNLPFLRRHRDKLVSIVTADDEIYFSVPSLREIEPVAKDVSESELAAIHGAYDGAILLQVLNGERLPLYDRLPESDGQREQAAWKEAAAALGTVIPRWLGESVTLDGRPYLIPQVRVFDK